MKRRQMEARDLLRPSSFPYRHNVPNRAVDSLLITQKVPTLINTKIFNIWQHLILNIIAVLTNMVLIHT